MKKLLYCAAALAGLFFAASCQQEKLEPVQESNAVTFTVEAPAAIQTKAIADGLNVDELIYEVWLTKTLGDLETDAQKLYQGTTTMQVVDGVNKATLTLDLVNDQKFTILFWAQVKNTGVYKTDELNAVTYTKVANLENAYAANDERLAAFYSVAYVDDCSHVTKDGDMTTGNVTLRRPFAQVNLGTLNTSIGEESTTGYTISLEESNMILNEVPTVFNVVNSEVSGYQTMQFMMYDVPAKDPANDTLTVNNKAYWYAGMNYVFAGVNDKRNITLTYNIKTKLNGGMEALVTNEVPNVPLRENYRTNIIGNLLTSNVDYEIVVDAEFNKPDDGVDYIWGGETLAVTPFEENGVTIYPVDKPSELAWVAEQVNNGKDFKGEVVRITTDLDLAGNIWTPIGANGVFKGTLEGAAVTKSATYPVIKNLYVKTEGNASAGLFANCHGTIKNITVKNAVVEGHYKTGVIVGDGLCSKIENCHVDGATVTVTPYKNDDANHVGGIVGYLSAELTAYVKNCSVKNATITGYRDVAGIAGTANGASVVTGNSVENVTVTSDQTVEYVDNTKDGNAGAVVGRIHANATVEPNTVGENVVVVRKVDSQNEFNAAVADAKSGDTIYIGAEVTMPYFTDKALNFEGLNADAVVKQSPATHIDEFYAGAELHFKNVTLVGTEYKGDTQGYQKAVKETYTECTFQNYIMFAGDETIVNKCNFVSNVGQYFWTATADDITFNECEFNVLERAVKVCTVGNNGERVVTFNGCQFTAQNPVKAAIEIDGTKGSSYVVNINSCTETGFAAGKNTGETLFNVEGKDNVTVYLDGSKWMGDGNFVDEAGNKTVSKQEALTDAVATEDAKVKVLAGEYTFPSDVAEGVTIECAEGAVFTGNTKLNIKGATVIGATFSNPSGTVVDQTINGTFKNCTFTGKNAVRWSYSGDTCVFEDCVFDGETYGFHSDGGSKPITFIRCSFSGFNAFAGAIPMVTFEDCVFKSNGKSGYNGANLWGSATFKNTKFMFDGSASNEWIDCIGTDKSYEFTGCTIGTDGSLFQPELIFSRNNGTNVTIDGKGYTWIGYFADAEGNTYVTNVADLQTVVDNAPVGNTTIHILNNLAGDATVAQKPDVKLVIDGNNKNYDGVITVDGKSATYTTAGLTVKNLTFNASSISGDACIRLGDGTNATRYTCNVAVENCTFAVPGAVGVKSYTGGDKNLKLSGCTATAAAHSLLQVAGVDEVLVEGCTINSKNGMNFNNSVKVTINECEADVKGYAARFGAGSTADTAVETYAITNSTLKSACEDGDAVIILRGTAANSTLTLTNTTLVGTTPITNNATDAKVIVDGKTSVSSTESFTKAIEGGETEIYLMPGNYTMPEPELRGKTLTITGSKDVVIDASAVDARDQFVTGATLKFEGVTLNFGKDNYMGFANTASLTYKDCNINGLQFLFGENVVFEDCDLDSNGAEHTVWTYGVKNVSFTGCDFTYGDRGVNCYSDNDVAGGKQTVNFTNCTFATDNTASEGAVEINSTYFSVGIEVNMEGCSAPAYGEMAYVSPWDSTNGAKTTINIK